MDESLRLIETPETTLASRYNARMQRVRREEDGVASMLVYDAQKLIAEAGVGANGEVERYYLAEGGSVYSPPVSQLGSQHWFLFDALGTTLGLAGEAGSLSDTFLYEAFGTSLGRTGTTATPYQYVGGYGYFREGGVGLEQVWWRWYRPQAGRWTTVDPVVLQHPYAYAVSNPPNLVDASGLLSGPCLAECLRDCWQMTWRADGACSSAGTQVLVTCVGAAAIACLFATVAWPECMAIAVGMCGQASTDVFFACMAAATLGGGVCAAACLLAPS